MITPVTVNVKKEIGIASGGSTCDFCQEIKSGWKGELKIQQGTYSYKSVVENEEYGMYKSHGENIFPGAGYKWGYFVKSEDIGYKAVRDGVETRTIKPVICQDCVLALAASVTKTKKK